MTHLKKEEACDEETEKIVEKEKEVVGDSVIVDFIRQVKPHVAKIKDEKQRKVLTDSMCKVIKSTLMNNTKKEESKPTVYSNFISKDSVKIEENPYDAIYFKFKGEK